MLNRKRLNKQSTEQVLLAARDQNVLINQRDNVYGPFPEVNAVRARNQIPPNFVHSIDAAHAKLTHIFMAQKGTVENKILLLNPFVTKSKSKK